MLPVTVGQLVYCMPFLLAALWTLLSACYSAVWTAGTPH